MRGIFGVDPAGTSASVIHSLKIVPVTDASSPYTITAAQTGTLFINTGAGAGVIFNLLDGIAIPATGACYLFGFMVDAAQLVTIQLAASNTGRCGGLVTAAAGTISDNTVGAVIWLVNTKNNTWVAPLGYVGAWNFV